MRIFDSGFENGVAELHTNDSRFGSAIAEFDISDSADHAVAAAANTGVDAVTGQGLDDVLVAAAVVVECRSCGEIFCRQSC